MTAAHLVCKAPPDSDVIQTVAAIAAFLGLHEAVCRKRVDAGEIPTFRTGDARCVRRLTPAARLAEREAAARKRESERVA